MPGSEEGLANALRFMFSRGASKKVKAFFKVLPFLQGIMKEGK
jgi:hypothetical protein